MRRTLCAEMLLTTPSATSWRASSVQSHWLRLQPLRSGISQAIFTRWRATSGENVGFLPGRGLSFNPDTPYSTTRLAHLCVCRWERPTVRAVWASPSPCANNSTARARRATPAGAVGFRWKAIKMPTTAASRTILSEDFRPRLAGEVFAAATMLPSGSGMADHDRVQEKSPALNM